MNPDLKIIKKLYGEKMMHLCREYFPTILETPSLLPSIMQEHFYPSRDLYENLISNQKENEFKNYIYSLIDKKYRPTSKSIKTPEELMSIAGYDLYECHTEEEIQSFKKYYKPNEALCTFHGGRLDRCRVFFAVKKDVANIKREDFSNPLRQDLYGTSVISIQFSKDGTNSLSIKNRYNHTVADPDATFSNDLDNIIAGLTDSFEEYYGIVQTFKSQNFEIPGYVRIKDKYYKYNYELDNYYYCPNNIIIDERGNVREYNHEKYIVMDYFLLDLVNKTIIGPASFKDPFMEAFQNITKIEVKKNGDTKDLTITNGDGQIFYVTLDKRNRIIGVVNNFIEEIPNEYLFYNKALQFATLPNVKTIGHDFNYFNIELEKIDISSVTSIGDNFLNMNRKLEELNAPNLVKIGHNFLYQNENLQRLNLPSLEEVYNNFLYHNIGLETLDLPKLKKCGDDFIRQSGRLSKVSLPLLTKVGHNFLLVSSNLTSLSLPSLRYVDDNFLALNNSLTSLETPSLEQVGHNFLEANRYLSKLDCPFLIKVGDHFMQSNYHLEYFNAPYLRERGTSFLPLIDQAKLNIPGGMQR